MSVGSLATLLSTLAAAPAMAGVSVVFGEENIDKDDVPLPKIVLVPRQGSYVEPGYIQNADPNLDMLWGTLEDADLYCVAFSTNPNPMPIDHADAVETLRAQVLQALWSQRATGLFWKPVSGKWATFQDAANRYGRAYVLTVRIELSIPDVAPAETTVGSLTLNAVI